MILQNCGLQVSYTGLKVLMIDLTKFINTDRVDADGRIAHDQEGRSHERQENERIKRKEALPIRAWRTFVAKWPELF